MIVSSADLSNSDKTDGFLKKTHAFTKDDFTGAFLQAGVSELTMACCCLGMALHGGVIAACATFFGHAFVRYSYIDQESNVWLCDKSAIHLF